MQSQSTDMVRRPTSHIVAPPEGAPDAELRMPRVDIFENTDEFLIVADLPGVTAESLDVQVEGAELRIEGLRAGSGAPDDDGVRYRRVFRVPRVVDSERIDASISNGVLEVHLAKAETAKPRRVEVRAS